MAIAEENIRGLISVLGQRQAAVEALPHDPRRNHALRLIEALAGGLEAALRDSEETWDGWLEGLSPLYAQLTPELTTLLALPSGACLYGNGSCIETDPDQCAQIAGSRYFPGQRCPRPGGPAIEASQSKSDKRSGTNPA